LQDCDEEFRAAFTACEVASGGQPTLSVALTRVVPLISSAIARLLRVLPKDANPNIAFSPNGLETWLVCCDELTVRSVLFELFLNAWKFKANGSAITIEVTSTGAAIKIAVSNEIEPLEASSGSISLDGIEVQSTQVEKDIGLETLFVSITKGLLDQPLDFVVQPLNGTIG
jgi:hypothetical protein